MSPSTGSQNTSVQPPPNGLSKRNKIILAVILVLLLGIGTPLLLRLRSSPVLKVQPPASLPATDREEFFVDITLSQLPEGSFPAASLVLDFDRNFLEFTGCKLGNMMVYNTLEDTPDETSFTIPQWECNTALSNTSGQIRTMYLDLTGGEHAYGPLGFASDSQDIVLRFSFRLKDSVSPGKTLKFSVPQAVFASSAGDQTKESLSNDETMKTLTIKNGTLSLT